MSTHVGDLLQSRPESDVGSSVGQVAIRTQQKARYRVDTGQMERNG